MSKDVEVLIPAATESVITASNISKISSTVKVIAEGANGPTTADADAILRKRPDVLVIPDFLCNAGGVICSYFEGVQNSMNYYWDEDEVNRRVEKKMVDAFLEVSATANAKNVYMRDAAYMIAVQRVVDAMRLRGWIS